MFKSPNQTQGLDSHIRILRDFKKCQWIFQICSTAVSADSIEGGAVLAKALTRVS